MPDAATYLLDVEVCSSLVAIEVGNECTVLVNIRSCASVGSLVGTRQEDLGKLLQSFKDDPLSDFSESREKVD